MLILISVIMLGALGFLFAGLLGLAADYFRVEEDSRIASVLAVLPGANCGACGMAGCRDYAEKVVLGQAAATACSACGAKGAAIISEIMGVGCGEVERKVAVVHCGAKGEQRKKKGNYSGVKTCMAVTLVDGGGLACTYGCLGYGDCLAICPFGAIEMREGLAFIDPEKCTGCGKCVSACPRKIISLRPYDFKVAIACSSRDSGAVVRKICPVGCIGCKLCVKQVADVFKVTDNLASIDYAKTGIACGPAVEKCPTKCIVTSD